MIYDKITNFDKCESKRLNQDTIELLKFIDTKQQFSVTDESFVQIRAKSSSMLDHAVQTAVKIGMIKPKKVKPNIPKWFEELNSISYWQKQLRGSMFKNSDSKRGTTTRITYLQMVWHFNKWLSQNEFQLKKTVFIGKETFKQEIKTVRFKNIEEMLLLLSEPFSPRVEIIKIIKQYLLDEMHVTKSKSYMIVISSAIKSYFEKNEYPLDIKYKCNTAQPEDLQNMSLSDVMTLLTNGKPSILEEAVFMCKFHRGLDASTLVDRFNYEAWEQITKWFGSDNPDSWDLEKCPVPIKLVRVKTSFLHIGFLDRDAVESIQKYIEYKIKKHPDVNLGIPLFVNKFGREISLGWVFEKFARIAKNAGLRIPTERKGQYTIDSHEFRNLLKSTLIDSGCRMDVADHVIGHKPKDSYEKQAKLYPETLQKEYAKASKRLNIFTKFTSVVNGTDDSDELRIELKEKISEMSKLKDDLVMEMAIKKKDEIIAQRQYEMMQDMQRQIDQLSHERRESDILPPKTEFCCINCSTVHDSQVCPACGSKLKRIFDSKVQNYQ
ncbi:MAG: hypothetical protein HRO68_10035 [Nitrosopumilus sp.]|nr:hypothetical protein [Nitrosopumilus sp.]